MTTARAALPSGREIAVTGLGDPLADHIVLICHPTPGTADFDPDPVETNRWGVHIVGVDRPGYGGSAALADGAHHSLRERSQEVTDFIASDERIADQISRADMHAVSLIGWGTGAVVAMSLAADRPEMIDRVALVSAPAPAKAAKAARRALAQPSGMAALHIAEDDPAFARHLGLDRRLERMLEGAALQGRAGIEADRELIANTAWIDALGGVTADVLVLTGEHDPLVDEDDARWWVKHLPNAHARTVPGSASLTIADAWRDVLGQVAPKHGSIPSDLRDHGRPVAPDIPPQS